MVVQKDGSVGGVDNQSSSSATWVDLLGLTIIARALEKKMQYASVTSKKKKKNK